MSGNKQTRMGPSQRTAAERAAIDTRASAYPRPLSAAQVQALKALAQWCGPGRHFVKSVAGWHAPGDSLTNFSTQTIDSLGKRGFVKRSRNAAVITTAGRREAARYR